MSQESVEILRRIYEGWASGEFRAGVGVRQARTANLTVPSPSARDTARAMSEENVATTCFCANEAIDVLEPPAETIGAEAKLVGGHAEASSGSFVERCRTFAPLPPRSNRRPSPRE